MNQTEFAYDSYNNKQTIQVYEVGSGAAGALLKRTELRYKTDASFLARNMLSLLASEEVYDRGAVTPTFSSQTLLDYDTAALTAITTTLPGWTSPGGVVKRGNLTSIQQTVKNPVDPTQDKTLTTARSYDEAGNLVKSVDARGVCVEYGYDNALKGGGAAGYAVPSKVKSYTGLNCTGTPLTAEAAIDYDIGKAVQFKDVNSNVVDLQYDTMGRVANVQRAAMGEQTLFTYTDTPLAVKVQTQVKQDAGGWVSTLREYDGMGRETRSRLDTGGADGEICTEKQYDGVGRLWRVSNPVKACGAGQDWTATEYDGLDRALTVTAPDGSVTRTVYEGSRTLMRDAAGRTRWTRVDGLGRLVEVRENEKLWRAAAVGVASEPTYTTTYGYNGRDLLTSVTQEGSGARGFVYDTAGRLVQATEPEWAKAARHQHDDSGNLIYRKDAADVVATMAYDGLNRVTQKSFSGSAAPTVSWCYDGLSWGGSSCTGSQANSLGRLTEVRNSVSSTRQTSFDGAGRVTASQQTPNGAPSYVFQYGYNLAGQRTSVVYPSGRSVSTAYDRAGRASSLTGVKGGVTTAYAAAMSYAAHGALAQMTLGNGVVEQWWHSGQWFQPRRVQWGVGSAESIGALEWQYCAAAGYATECASNDGNVQRQVIRPLAETQSYTFDAVNRLTSATAGWSQAYGYDNGNLIDRRDATLANLCVVQSGPGGGGG